MRAFRQTRRIVGVSAVLMLGLAGIALGSGAAEPEAEEKGAPAAPAPVLARPLDGRFDLSSLRKTSRLDALRCEVPPVIATLGAQGKRSIQARISLTLEFGAETGLAEVKQAGRSVQQELAGVVSGCNAKRLTTVAGKLELKEEIIRALNRRLQTAQVRQVYFTDCVFKAG